MGGWQDKKKYYLNTIHLIIKDIVRIVGYNMEILTGFII
jgi:hypothetical protein